MLPWNYRPRKYDRDQISRGGIEPQTFVSKMKHFIHLPIPPDGLNTGTKDVKGFSEERFLRHIDYIKNVESAQITYVPYVSFWWYNRNSYK